LSARALANFRIQRNAHRKHPEKSTLRGLSAALIQFEILLIEQAWYCGLVKIDRNVEIMVSGRRNISLLSGIAKKKSKGKWKAGRIEAHHHGRGDFKFEGRGTKIEKCRSFGKLVGSNDHRYESAFQFEAASWSTALVSIFKSAEKIQAHARPIEGDGPRNGR
jgi:hypothetical protein